MKKIKSMSLIAVILAFTLALTGCVKGYVIRESMDGSRLPKYCGALMKKT